LQLVPRLVESYDVDLVCHLVGRPAAIDAPDESVLEEYVAWRADRLWLVENEIARRVELVNDVEHTG
jgi:hypothetical protein